MCAAIAAGDKLVWVKDRGVAAYAVLPAGLPAAERVLALHLPCPRAGVQVRRLPALPVPLLGNLSHLSAA